MKKYIDVDALGIGKANPEVFLHPEYAHGWNNAVEIVLTAPAADVVSRDCYDRLLAENDALRKERPVVRCVECKHRHDDNFCGGRGWPAQLVPDDGYCDRGARMDGDGDV